MTEGRATFYFDVNSPYAYLAAHRIDQLIPGTVWRPIALAMLFRELGKIPWSLTPEVEEGMAECQRRAAARGLPPMTWPEGWPAETWSLNPLRAALVAEEHGLIRPFALECFRSLFVENRSLAELDSTLAVARSVGLDPDEVRERMGERDVKDRLHQYTDEAMELGAEGVPTVVVGGELFWGDDRLEEAAAAAHAAA